MDRADAGTGEHGHDSLGDHWHVEAHPVTFTDTALFERVRQATDLFVKFPIGDGATLIRLVALPDDRRLLPTCRQMAVDTVETGIQSPAFEPADVSFREIPIEHLLPASGPAHKPVGLFAPESLWIFDRTSIHIAVSLFSDMGPLPKLIRYRIGFLTHNAPRRPFTVTP